MDKPNKTSIDGQETSQKQNKNDLIFSNQIKG